MRLTKLLQLVGWQFDYIADHLGSIILRSITAGAAKSRGSAPPCGEAAETQAAHALVIRFCLLFLVAVMTTFMIMSDTFVNGILRKKNSTKITFLKLVGNNLRYEKHETTPWSLEDLPLSMDE